MTRPGSIVALSTLVLLLSPFARAQDGGDLRIEAKPVPGQLDVLQGTAIQVGGKAPETGPRPSSFLWEVVEGEGAKLLKPDEAEAIFQAPVIEKDLELFVVQLTVQYEGQEPARAQLHIRVHRQMPEMPEKTIEQKMADYYRENRAKTQSRGRRRDRTVIHHGSAYPSWHFGFHWGWNWPVYYPIYVPIILPPPGGEWLPGDGEWIDPTPIPYDELVTTFPEQIADDYLPQDFPMAEPSVGGGFFGDSPGDLIGAPDIGAPDLMPMDIPDFGPDFAEPMIDPGFGFDDFGW